MTFAYPLALYGLLLLPPLAWLAWRRWQREQAAQAAFAGAPARLKMGLGAERWLFAGRVALLLLAWSAVVVALARPQGDPVAGEGERLGSDVVLAIDVSDSMRALDGAPGGRLDAVRSIVGTLLRDAPGDRFALVAFAGSAATLCPLTDDYGVISSFVEELDFNGGVEPGSSLTSAVISALRRFPEGGKAGRAIVLFTDGEDLSGQVDTAVELAGQRGIPIVAVGVGSTRGAPIPVGEDIWGNLVFKQHEGQEVKTLLEEAPLKQLARRTGGRYLRGDSRWKAAQQILSFLDAQSKRALRSSVVQRYQEYFPWLLALAIAALAGELALAQSRYRLVLPARRRRRPPAPPPATARGRQGRANPKGYSPEAKAATATLVLLAWCQVSWSWPWEPYTRNSQGLEAMQRKEFGPAAQAFGRAAEVSGHFAPYYNMGNAYYRDKRYKEALNAYGKALELAPEEAKARVHYNMGNALYRLATGKEREKLLRKSLFSYEQALRLRPDDGDAQTNADFVRRLLEKKPPPAGQPSPSPSPGGSGSPSPSPGASQSPGGSPSPNPSASGDGASPSPGASGSPGGRPSAAPTPAPNPEEVREIEEFLHQVERAERMGQNYFRHRAPGGQQGRTLADIPVDELMNMSPEELAELLRQQATGQQRRPARGGKDW